MMEEIIHSIQVEDLMKFKSIINKTVPIWEKANLSIQEAALYSGIGRDKLREITDDERCNFVLYVGNKRLIKRRLFDKYIEGIYSI